MTSVPNWIWLSHVNGKDTPAYGGGEGIRITADKVQAKGDSCNTTKLEMSNHIGSHVDAPSHFIVGGKCIDEYGIDDWIFLSPIVIDITVAEASIVTVAHISDALISDKQDADLVLIRTGFEKHRAVDTYWNASPGFSPDIYDYLKERFHSLKAIGLDTISISSIKHRDLGREAHRAFLSGGIRIFEDLQLSNIEKLHYLKKIIALPFRFGGADGAPITMIAEVGC